MRWVALAALLGSLSGCIIYDEEFVVDGDTAAVEDDTAFELRLEPARALAGDSVIVSLLGEGDVDLRTVVDVDFAGVPDIEVLAMDERNTREFLVTITVDAESQPGLADVIVRFEDGTRTVIDEGFEVLR